MDRKTADKIIREVARGEEHVGYTTVAKELRDVAAFVEALAAQHSAMYKLLSNMPAIDQGDSMNMLWVTERDRVLTSILNSAEETLA